MKNINVIFLYAVIAIAAIAPISLMVYNTYTSQKVVSPYVTVEYLSEKPKDMVVGSEFPITSCQIVDGHIFIFALNNEQMIEGRLKIATKEEATPAVIEVLKTAVSPSVVLLRKVGPYWIVDLNLTTNAKRTTLVEWLEDKKLTL